jgi:hypothetical protein
MKDAGQNARRRLFKSAQTRLERGFTEGDYIRLERMLKMGDRVLFQAQRLLNLRQFNYSALVGKFVSSILLSISLVLQTAVLTFAVVLAVALWESLAGGETRPLLQTFQHVLTRPAYQLFLLLLFIIGIRRILFRLRDKEVTR